MTKFNESWSRSDLKAFVPYHDAHKPFIHKLNANESPFTLTDNVRAKFLDWLQNRENLNIYPDTDSTELRAAISRFWGLDCENVVCGVGSDQIIDYITKAFLEFGDKIIIPNPTFSMYALTSIINRGKIIEAPLNEDYSVDVENTINITNDQRAKLLFLCTPNNPTGNSLNEQSLKRVLEGVNCVVVVDEAYAEFSGGTIIPYINKYENLIVLRTFSKAYSLAGARVGYAVACEQMIEVINKVKAPYNLPVMSQMLAVLALEDSEEYKKRVDYLKAQRESLYIELKKINWLEVYPSDGNFIFAKSSKLITNALEEKGILIRRFGKPMENAEVVRFTVGTKEQNSQLLMYLSGF